RRGALRPGHTGALPISALMRDVDDQFLDRRLQGRMQAGVQMTKQHLENDLAGGRIWTGRQAKANGLIDELGTLDDAIAGAKKLAGVEGQEMELLILPHAKTFIERIADAADAKAPAIGAELLPVLRSMPELRPHLQKIAGLLQLRNEKVWLISPFAVQIK